MATRKPLVVISGDIKEMPVGDFCFSGYSVNTASANYTLTSSDVVLDCTANSFTVTLPTYVGITGKAYIVKNSGSGIIILAANGTELIDLVNSISLPPGCSITLYAGSSSWKILNTYYRLTESFISTFSQLIAVNAINGSTNLTAFGVNTSVTLGTTTAATIATTSKLTRLTRVSFASSGLGAFVGYRQAVASFTTHSSGTGGFYFQCTFGIEDALPSGARTFVGITSNTSAPSNVEPNTLTNSIGIGQISTDNTQLYLFQGGASAASAIALGTTNFPISATIPFKLEILSYGGINKVVVTNLSNYVSTEILLTSIPSSTTLLTYSLWRTNNTGFSAVSLSLSSLRVNIFV